MKKILLKQESLEWYKVDLNDEDLEGIINATLNYYAQKAVKSKIMFYAFNITILICNVSIPVIVQVFAEPNILVTITSSISSIFASILILMAIKDSWQNYRKYLEELKIEIVKYKSSSDGYKALDDSSKKNFFMERFCEISTKDTSSWELKHDSRKLDSSTTTGSAYPFA